MLGHQLALGQLQATHHQFLLAPGKGLGRGMPATGHPDIRPLGARMGIALFDMSVGSPFSSASVVGQRLASQPWR